LLLDIVIVAKHSVRLLDEVDLRHLVHVCSTVVRTAGLLAARLVGALGLAVLVLAQLQLAWAQLIVGHLEFLLQEVVPLLLVVGLRLLVSRLLAALGPRHQLLIVLRLVVSTNVVRQFHTLVARQVVEVELGQHGSVAIAVIHNTLTYLLLDHLRLPVMAHVGYVQLEPDILAAHQLLLSLADAPLEQALTGVARFGVYLLLLLHLLDAILLGVFVVHLLLTAVLSPVTASSQCVSHLVVLSIMIIFY